MIKRNNIMSGALSIALVMGFISPQLTYAYEDENSEYYQVEGYSAHSAVDSKGITWSYSMLKNGTIVIFGTNQVSSYMEVPEQLDGKNVALINRIVAWTNRTDPDYGKKEAMITKIKLPSTVKIIDSGAFSLCKNLMDIEMPEGVKMDEGIFASCPNVRVNNKANNTNPNAPTDTSNLNIGWNLIGNDRYYVDSNRKLKTGWMDLSGKRYYFYGNGQMAVSFINLGGDSVYYLDPKVGNNMGNLITGWSKIDENWYYFNSKGEDKKEKGFMQTGWLYNNGSWYYFYGNGQMATGFINLGGDAFYYLDESDSSSVGIMRTGWQRINGSWYYFNKATDKGIEGMMKKGWQKIDGIWYYFYSSDGKMAHNERIDGYYVNASGAWVK